ncbi:MAG TPA: metallophosphoesterase [Ktedonobacteraceae bacterium]|nr:metallophosphoesterase [Ktedonobacteraceae bacterium]
MKRRSLLRATLAATVGTIVVSGGTSFYAHTIEPAWIEINTLPVHLPRLDPAFHGYRIVHITDIHIDDAWMTAKRLEEIVQLVNGQKADLVVITGDFVTDEYNISARTLAPLRYLQARDGVLAVLGNHDIWSGPELIRSILEDNDVRVLADTTHSIQRHDAALHIIGMDDLWPSSDVVEPVWTHKDRFQRLTDALPDTGAAILLVHEPDFADIAAANGRCALQLSGHSHGGQIRVPFLGAIQVPPLASRYRDGLYRVGQMLHYTNRGLGMVEPRVRLNCLPEIATFVCLADGYAKTPW